MISCSICAANASKANAKTAEDNLDSANSKLVEQKNVLQDKQSKEAAAKEAAQAADSTAKADKAACDSLQQLLDNVDAAQKTLNDSLGGKLENMVRKSLCQIAGGRGRVTPSVRFRYYCGRLFPGRDYLYPTYRLAEYKALIPLVWVYSSPVRQRVGERT